MGRILHLFCIFALVSEICSAQEDPKKKEKLLDLAKQIVPGMKGQSLALGDILKALKVLRIKNRILYSNLTFEGSA